MSRHLSENPSKAALRMRVKRKGQLANLPKFHHPKEKTDQINRILNSKDKKLKIVELFAGQGNLTKVYQKFGQVKSCDISLGTGDSYIYIHSLIGNREEYDVIDADDYGFPNRLFPDIFMLTNVKKETIMFLTFPKMSKTFKNLWNKDLMKNYFGVENPTPAIINKRISEYGRCHLRDIELLEMLDLGSVWRLAYRVKKYNARRKENYK